MTRPKKISRVVFFLLMSIIPASCVGTNDATDQEVVQLHPMVIPLMSNPTNTCLDYSNLQAENFLHQSRVYREQVALRNLSDLQIAHDRLHRSFISQNDDRAKIEPKLNAFTSWMLASLDLRLTERIIEVAAEGSRSNLDLTEAQVDSFKREMLGMCWIIADALIELSQAQKN